MSGAVAEGVIGIASTVISTAIQGATSAIQNADWHSNLATSVIVVNGTDYNLNPRWSSFRRGAAFGGYEGEFLTSPKPVGPRQAHHFACTQIRGSTADVIGAVVYECEVFYWLIGVHAYDQAGIQRYIYSGIFPKQDVQFRPIEFRELDLWAHNADWGPRLEGFWPNQLIWSGAGPRKSSESSKGTTVGRGLKVKGSFYRGMPTKDKDGKLIVDDKGLPVMEHTKVTGDGKNIEFSSNGNGGGQHMNAVVADRKDLYSGQEDDAARVETMIMPS